MSAMGCFIKNDLMKVSHEHILEKVKLMDSSIYYRKDSAGVMITSVRLPDMVEMDNSFPIVTAKAIRTSCL